MSMQTHLPWYLGVFGALKALHIGAYLLKCHRLVVDLNQRHPAQPTMLKIRQLTLMLGIGLAIDALLFAAESLGIAVPVSSDSWGAAVLTTFVYLLAYASLRLPLDYVVATRTTQPVASLLAPADRLAALEKLRISMEEQQLFQAGDLSLDQLASHLALTPHELSQLINQSFGVNFQEYLNGHRVRYLQAALQHPDNAEATILDLALAAGFNSKSSLNRVFKQHTGTTPSQFRQTTQGTVP